MNDRRRAERYVLDAAAVGSLRLLQDVLVSRIEDDRAVVITSSGVPRGERLRLEIDDGEVALSVLGRAVRSRAIAGDQGLGQEVVLTFLPSDEHAEVPPRFPGHARVHPTRPLVGALSRRVPVRVVEVSRLGCRFDSPSCLGEGTVGLVDVRSHDQRRTEAIRIGRSWREPDQVWPYRTVAEFLTLSAAQPNALRGVATILASGGRRVGVDPGTGTSQWR